MKINNTIITNNDLYFWIEEGQACLGDMKTALKFIETASKVGANGIEFQLAIADEFYIQNHDMHKHYKNIEYSNEDIQKLIKYSKENNIDFIACVLSHTLIPLLIESECDVLVISASDINNPAIIDPILESKIPFFISLPLSTEEEIEWIINRCFNYGTNNFSLMLGQHTMAGGTNGVALDDTNMGYIKTLKDKYNIQVGFIDHSRSIYTPSIARAAGANFISKHMFLEKNTEGSDWFVCLDPVEMTESISLARKINYSLNNTQKVLAKGEEIDINIMRRSTVASQDIVKGSVITKSMISFKRPGGGVPPHQYEKFIGKTALENIKKDDFLSEENVEL
ncbi:MAG: N-acetylneuraminate synthase family protein [Bacteroidales bacterium]|nr:N-acetylneuraminate synthase family protein [Bacteroidales bacterium]